jgi:hypothetical protein
VGRCGLDSSDAGQELAMNSCEHNNEILGPVKFREFLL